MFKRGGDAADALGTLGAGAAAGGAAGGAGKENHGDGGALVGGGRRQLRPPPVFTLPASDECGGGGADGARLDRSPGDAGAAAEPMPPALRRALSDEGVLEIVEPYWRTECVACA